MLYLKNTFYFFRSTLYYACFIAFTIICCTVLPLLTPLPYRYRSAWVRFWCWLATHTLRLLCGVRFRFIFEAPLPKKPCLYLSNHQSAWEPLAFFAYLPNVCYVIKKELLYLPFFGWGAACTHNIAIDRSRGIQAFRAMVKKGQVRVKSGLSIVIYPEGTRAPAGKLKSFQKGGVMLAEKLNLPIIPITHNAGDVWPRNTFIKRPGLVTVVVGKPLETKELRTDEIQKLAYRTIKGTMDSLSGRLD